MIKRILIICSFILLSVYLIAAMTMLNTKPEEQECEGLVLKVKDDVDYGFVTRNDIRNLLKAKKLLPDGKKMKDINIRNIEEILMDNPFIREAECYTTSGGKIGIDIYQRIPILRVMSTNGDNYYVDSEGKVMNSYNKPVHVPIATGVIDRKFAQNELFHLAQYIRENEFWNAQTEQINVTSKQEIEIVPRVGNQILFLGKAKDYDEKFSKLQTFYSQALKSVGWNKYKRISIEFNNQIICTKKGE